MFILYFFIQNVYSDKNVFKKKGKKNLFNGSNSDRKSQVSGILTEPLNPRDVGSLDNKTIFCLRDHENLDQFERFELENNQDIQSCWRFFSGIMNRVSEGSGHHSGIMLSLLVKICQKDFELWWKHYRRTENKVV